MEEEGQIQYINEDLSSKIIVRFRLVSENPGSKFWKSEEEKNADCVRMVKSH